MNNSSDNSIISHTDSNCCSICRELLDNLSRFFEMLDSVRKAPADDLLKVEDVAQELKVSKSIIYQLVRNGELGAVDIVSNDGMISQKGHCRIKRKELNLYLERKTVNPLPQKSRRSYQPRNLPKVKNHLGL